MVGFSEMIQPILWALCFQKACDVLRSIRLAAATLRATLDKGPRSRVQRNWAFLLVKSFKLVPRPLDKSPRPRQIKLWFSLHGIILEGKPIGLEKKRAYRSSWFGEPKCKLIFLFFVFFFIVFFLSLLLKFYEIGRHAMDWGCCWEHNSSPIFDQF
jgi:hypothetical protein